MGPPPMQRLINSTAKTYPYANLVLKCLQSVRELRDIALDRNVASVVSLYIAVDSCSICQNVPMKILCNLTIHLIYSLNVSTLIKVKLPKICKKSSRHK